MYVCYKCVACICGVHVFSVDMCVCVCVCGVWNVVSCVCTHVVYTRVHVCVHALSTCNACVCVLSVYTLWAYETRLNSIDPSISLLKKILDKECIKRVCTFQHQYTSSVQSAQLQETNLLQSLWVTSLWPVPAGT